MAQENSLDWNDSYISENEEECRLYSQLYFDPNPCSASSADDEIKYGHESFTESKFSQLIKDDSKNGISLNTNLQNGKNKCSQEHITVESDFKDAVDSVRQRPKRKRLLSTESVQSIPGSVLLDALYCLPEEMIVEDVNLDPEISHNIKQDKMIDVCEWVNNKGSGAFCGSSVSSTIQKDNKHDVFINSYENKTSTGSKYFALQHTNEHTTLQSFIENFNKKRRLKKSTGRQIIEEPVEYVCDEYDASNSNDACNNSVMLANLSICPSAKLHDNALKRVYGTNNKSKLQKLWPVDFTAGKVLQGRTPSVAHWTPKMTTFYESDFSDEFDLKDIHKQMPDNIVNWDILEDDLPYSTFEKCNKGSTDVRRRRYFGTERCKICRSYDHQTQNCCKVRHCHLCGETDHFTRESCPSNTCFRCGVDLHHFCEKTTPWNLCTICNRKGHVKELCPDIWRRFCYTTSGETPLQPPPGTKMTPYMPTAKTSCFSCGRTGHIGPDCNHRVQNYVVLDYRVVSFVPPTINLLGMKVLREMYSKDLTKSANGLTHSYGKKVILYTAARASVVLKPGTAGLVIGRDGKTIKALTQLSGCKLDVTRNQRPQLLWIYGPDYDPVIRAILFFIYGDTTVSLENLDDYAEALDRVTNGKIYVKQYEAAMKKLRKRLHRIVLKEKKLDNKQKLEVNNNSRLKRNVLDAQGGNICIKEKSPTKLLDSTEVIYLSDSDSDICCLRQGCVQSFASQGSFAQGSIKGFKGATEGNFKRLRQEETSEEENGSKSAVFGKLFSKGKRKRRLYSPSIDGEGYNSSASESSLDSVSKDYIDNSSFDTINIDADSGIELGLNSINNISPGINSEVIEINSSEEETDEQIFLFEHSRQLVISLIEDFKNSVEMLTARIPEDPVKFISFLERILRNLESHVVNVNASLRRLRKSCKDYKSTQSNEALSKVRDHTRNLAKFVYGTKKRGCGKKHLRYLEEVLECVRLSAGTSSNVSTSVREKVAACVQSVCRVDERHLPDVVRHAKLLVSKKGIRKNIRSVMSTKRKRIKNMDLDSFIDPFTGMNAAGHAKEQVSRRRSIDFDASLQTMRFRNASKAARVSFSRDSLCAGHKRSCRGRMRSWRSDFSVQRHNTRNSNLPRRDCKKFIGRNYHKRCKSAMNKNNMSAS